MHARDDRHACRRWIGSSAERAWRKVRTVQVSCGYLPGAKQTSWKRPCPRPLVRNSQTSTIREQQRCILPEGHSTCYCVANTAKRVAAFANHTRCALATRRAISSRACIVGCSGPSGTATGLHAMVSSSVLRRMLVPSLGMSLGWLPRGAAVLIFTCTLHYSGAHLPILEVAASRSHGSQYWRIWWRGVGKCVG